MSRAKLNIWLRYADCSLITDCWRTDLVIKSCCGDYLVDSDPSLIEQLKARYKDYDRIELNPDYMGSDRILLQPSNNHDRYINHIEVDVPPGCYIVWTRVCYKRNEETNKVMVIVRCGEEACINLLLDAVETCTNELFHPFFKRAVELELDKDILQGAIRGMMAVGRKPKREVEMELEQRLGEWGEKPDPGIQKATREIMSIMKKVPEC